MANDILTNQTSAYDGSPSGSNDVFTATGPVRLTITGRWDGAILTVFSRTNTNTEYQGAEINSDIPRPRIALISGDSYYYTLTNVGDNTSLSVTDEAE